MSTLGFFGACETRDQCCLDMTCDLYEQSDRLGEDHPSHELGDE